jgi:alkanesulfonate monooxygenase SsuD/methylene tetrahydromethanopterin reductase-like flavin-dependent oxidoreductase (luciferase family)
MNFHWALRTNSGSDSVANIARLSSRLNHSGYKSMLLTYFSKSQDNWIKAVKAGSENESIKYLVAIRTYAISPEYCAMICRSFEEILPNKLSLNIVHGSIKDSENVFESLVNFDQRLESAEGRRIYTRDWLEKFLNLDHGNPEIYLSGNSDETRGLCNYFNVGHAASLNKFKKYLNAGGKVINSIEMIAASIVIRDTDEEALSFIMNSNEKNMISWTIYGSQESVESQIKELETIGVTDIMIDGYLEDEEYFRIDKMVKEWQ